MSIMPMLNNLDAMQTRLDGMWANIEALRAVQTLLVRDITEMVAGESAFPHTQEEHQAALDLISAKLVQANTDFFKARLDFIKAQRQVMTMRPPAGPH